ncbi:MAG: FAD-binding oxidoreductase [Rhodobacteraceae bacterium]|jgi:glycine/D-amino acid oxidase-like deaminating enzyme|nr:FAD-binding oxidoreductase [Paracoccaceae bacterium]
MSTVDLGAVDLTVRGAGVFGLAVAWEAARRGARVRVVDPRGPGAGASGGVVGALAPHAPEGWTDAKAFQLQGLLAAPGFWAGVEAAGGLTTGFGRTGRVQPLPDAAAVARARDRAAGAATLWPAPVRWDVTGDPPADAPPSPTGLWVVDSLSARLSPAATVAALVAAIRTAGGEVVADAPARGAVLHATGWEGLRAAGMGGGVKGQAVVLDHAAPDAPQVYADGLHIVFHADGTTAVGSTSERDWTDPAGTDGQAEALVARARAILPALAQAPVLRRWAGVRPRTPSRQPLLGPWPGRPGHFIANGGFKIGFGLAPAVATVMADLILDGRDSIPAALRPTD